MPCLPFTERAFGACLFALFVVNFGVYELEKALFHVDYHGADIHAHLGRGEACAVFGTDGHLHIVQKRGKLAVEVFDLFADFAQDGVAHLHDIPLCHIYTSVV